MERRIQKAEAGTPDDQMPDLDRPAGVPAAYADHARLMFDLQVLAMQADVTRVMTFQLARETSNRTYPEIGVSDPHHPLTHHGNDADKIAKMAKIDAFHVSLFAYYLDKLKATPDGDGTLLDHSLVLYGSAWASQHPLNVNRVMGAGGAAGGQGWTAYPTQNRNAGDPPTLLERVGVRMTRSQTEGKVETSVLVMQSRRRSQRLLAGQVRLFARAGATRRRFDRSRTRAISARGTSRPQPTDDDPTGDLPNDLDLSATVRPAQWRRRAFGAPRSPRVHE